LDTLFVLGFMTVVRWVGEIVALFVAWFVGGEIGVDLLRVVFGVKCLREMLRV